MQRDDNSIETVEGEIIHRSGESRDGRVPSPDPVGDVEIMQEPDTGWAIMVPSGTNSIPDARGTTVAAETTLNLEDWR